MQLLFYSEEAAPQNCLILQRYISSKVLPTNLKFFNHIFIVIRREWVHLKVNAIPLLRIFAPSTLENRQIFTMKVQVYSRISEYLNTSINNFSTGILDCQFAVEIHIVPREKIGPFQIQS